MSDAFAIDMPGLPGYQHAIQAAPADLQSEMLVAARRIGHRGSALSSVYVPVGETGNLKSTIYGDGHATATGVQAIFGASADYAAAVDKGRGAGKKMPPAGTFLPYIAKSVTLEPGETAESVDFAIRRKIGRDGIKARPFVTKAFKELTSGGITSAVYSEFRGAIKRTLAKIAGHG